MYLSRLELDLNKRETMRALVSPARFHGAVESAFSAEIFDCPIPSDSGRDRKLWRLDTLGGRTYLLLLSEKCPDLRRADEQFGTGHGGETRDYAPLLDSIREGEALRFRLTANPSSSKSRARGPDGKKPRGEVKAFLAKPEDHKGWFRNLKTWLMRKADNNGFSLKEESFDVVESRWRRFRKWGDEKRPVMFLSATYEGGLKVTDAEAFRAALICGIGREKAYGMGLLTVMREGVPHG